MDAVRFLRIAFMVVYASYLTNVGLLLIVLPWSDLWPRVILWLPPKAAAILDSPLIRGGLTAFGVLHLLLVLAELVMPVHEAQKDH